MLVLSRQRDETIMIGDDIEITVVDIRGDKIRLGISAPARIAVHRKEVYEAIRRENEQAAQNTTLDVLPARPAPVRPGPQRSRPARPAARPPLTTPVTTTLTPPALSPAPAVQAGTDPAAPPGQAPAAPPDPGVPRARPRTGLRVGGP